MALSTANRKRAQPATHWTVYLGLLLAAAGLVVAMYAYTGTRIYDIVYAYAAIAGGVVALVGILVSAWGRAVMTTRAQRSRRAAVREAFERPAATAPAQAEDADAPTVAARPEKKRRFALGKGAKAEAKPEGTLFSFRRRQGGATAAAAVEVPIVTESAPAPDATGDGAAVRITLKCPRCATEFSAEGVQPITLACPSCGLSGTV